MAKWAFLTPWLDALRAHTTVELRTASTADTATGRRHEEEPSDSGDPFQMVPRVDHLTLRLDRELLVTQASRATLREAVVMVACALRDDPSVWSQLQLRPQPEATPAANRPQRIHHRLFREDHDLNPSFQLHYQYHPAFLFQDWLALVCELFTGEDDNGNIRNQPPEWVTHLQSHGLDQAPVVTLSFSVDVNSVDDSDALASLATTLETICAKGTSVTDSYPRVFRVTQLELTVATLTSAMVSPLARIQALGIRIVAVDVLSASYTDGLHACLALLPASLCRLRLQMPKYDNSLALYATLLQPTGLLQNATLAVCVPSPYFFDRQLLAQLVQSVWSQNETMRVRSLDLTIQFLSPGVLDRLQTPPDTIQSRRVRINPETRRGIQLMKQLTDQERETVLMDTHATLSMVRVRGYDYVALPSGRLLEVEALDAVEIVPAGQNVPPAVGTRHVSHQSPISLRCTILRANRHAIPRLIAWLPVCLPALRSLDLYIGYGATFTAESVQLILDAYPLLESLALSHTSLTSLQVVLDGYNDGRCSRLRVLSLDAGDLGFVPFFATLADRKSTIARTLTELKLRFVDDEESVYLNAIETMLQRNRVLQFLELVLVQPSETTIDRVVHTLRPLHRVSVAASGKVREDWSRAKWAFLSVWTKTTESRPAKRPAPWRYDEQRQQRQLTECMIALVLAFAAPCQVRLIHLKREMRRTVFHCNHAYFNGCHLETVDDELFPL